MKTMRSLLHCAVLLLGHACAEEIWLFDNTRLTGTVESFKDGKIKLQAVDGTSRDIALDEIIAVTFRGRAPRLVQSGTQEFHFIRGGVLRAEILSCKENVLEVSSSLAGNISVDLSTLSGFVSLPREGFSGRKADEMVGSRETPALDTGGAPLTSPNLDWVVDKRGAKYPGALRALDRTKITLDHEELLQAVPIETVFVAGVRLADASRKPSADAGDRLLIRIQGRDGSAIKGELSQVQLGVWSLRPLWNVSGMLSINSDEIVTIQIINGRVQYLSQLDPIRVDEKTVTVPPQPYRRDASCQGERLSIGAQNFPWGIGVHANSSLTYKLNGSFKTFSAAVGIASSMGSRGSVIFKVLGNGKELYASPLIKGSAVPVEISVPVTGVDELTLQVTDGGDQDLGDAANWGAPRLSR